MGNPTKNVHLDQKIKMPIGLIHVWIVMRNSMYSLHQRAISKKTITKVKIAVIFSFVKYTLEKCHMVFKLKFHVQE